jgi:TonB family protein
MSEETFPVANVGGREVPYDPEQLRRIKEHPCFSEKACHAFGRMHLAVAPRCNIQCKYCVRDFDCVNESRPGVTSQVLTPQEALSRKTEGNAVIRFTINASGALAGYYVTSTSGSPVLDEGALTVVRAAAPYAPLPAAFQLARLHITATFSYRMQ